FDAPQAVLHFLAQGYVQTRNVTCGALPDGLDGIRSLAPLNRHYIVELFRSLFFSQVRNPRTADRLWAGIDPGLVECLRAMGGRPYVVIGDSHANHYLRWTSLDERWLAALPMVCIATAAMQLADEHSRTGFGQRILQWARATAEPGRRFNCRCSSNSAGSMPSCSGCGRGSGAASIVSRSANSTVSRASRCPATAVFSTR